MAQGTVRHAKHLFPFRTGSVVCGLWCGFDTPTGVSAELEKKKKKRNYTAGL
jgi:hypothetical protein